jgi:hypothetical protein
VTETGQGAVSPRDVRVSDVEREHVVGLLQRAIGRGLLDLDEFTRRTDVAFAARTRGELNAVLVDLPGMAHRDEPLPGTPWRPFSSSGPFSSGPFSSGPFSSTQPQRPASSDGAGDRLELTAHGSALNRSGRWSVPTELVVRNKYGSTKLDFTEAEFSGPVVNLHLDTMWGSVEIIVGEEASVDLNAITEVKWAALDDKTRSTGGSGSPRFVFTGRVYGGSLTVKNPRRGLFS